MGMFDKAKKAAADTLTEDIKMIDVDDLCESPDNFFELTNVEEFADTILSQGGVKENLIVKPIGNGEYEIISGHRRTAAVRYLLEKGENISRYLPCLVQEYNDEDEKMLDLILMNISARKLSDNQLYKSYEIINGILQEKKKLGEKFGNVQKKLAEILGVSTGQVAKMQAIDKNAAPEVKEAIRNGNLSINTADVIKTLDNDKQKKIISEKPVSKLKPKDIEKITIAGKVGNNEDLALQDNDKKVTINGNYTETDDTDSEHEDEKITINDNFGEKKASPVKEKKEVSPALDNLYSYVIKNDDIIFEILNNYLKVTDDQRERNVISSLKDFMRYARNVSDGSDVLIAIFDTYLGMTDNKQEREVIAAVKQWIQE